MFMCVLAAAGADATAERGSSMGPGTWISGIIALVVIYNSVQARKQAKQQQEQALQLSRVLQLEQQNKAMNEQLVQANLDKHTSPLREAIKLLTGELSALNRKVEEGRLQIDGLDDRDHKAELKTQAKIDELKDYIRDHAASKEDMRRMTDKVTTMGERVAGVEAQVKTLVGRHE